jgi:serine/threonine-protein phosphatase Stp1
VFAAQAPNPRSGVKVSVGVACRELHREDRTLINVDIGLFGVFDGVSLNGGGADAATVAVDAVHDWVAQNFEPSISIAHAERLLLEALKRADVDLAAYNAAGVPDPREAATTAAVVLLCVPGGSNQSDPVAIATTLGDSRIYLLRRARLYALSQDHSYPTDNDLARAKSRQDRLDHAASMDDLDDPIDRNAFRHRNIISTALEGSGQVDARQFAVELDEGDRLAVTSDGIHDNLTRDELAAALTAGATAQQAADSAADAAWQRSQQDSAAVARAKPDDISIVVIDLPAGGGAT